MQQFRASRLAGAPPAGAEGSLGEARASEAAVDRFTITYVGNVHWSGRSPAKADHNTSLWGGFAIKGPRHNFFYGGDTSYFRKDFDEFRKVGRLLGPFHLAALAIGAYEPNEDLRYQHVNPQEALMLFKDIRAEVGVGVHWGTMRLSAENFFDPMLELECALLGVSPLATKEAAVPDGKRGKKAATQEAAAGSGERAGSGADAGAKKKSPLSARKKDASSKVTSSNAAPFPSSSSADASAEGASTAREEETDTLVAGSTLTASVLFEPEPELEAAPTVAAATAAGAAAAADDAPSSSRGTTREADGEAAKGTGLKAADTPAQTPSLQRRQPHSKLRDAIDHLLENPLSVLRRGRRPTNMREAIFPGHFYRSTLQPVALWSDPLLHPSNARRLRRAEKLEALGLLHHDPHWREKLLVEGARFQTLHIGHSIQVEQGDDGTHILMSRSSARDHIDPQATAEQYAFLPLYLKPASAGVSNGRNSGVRNGAKGTHARGGGVSASPMEAARGQQSDEVGSMEVAFSRVAVGVGVPNLRRQQRAAPAGSAIRPSSKADSPVAAGVEEEDEETEVFDIMD
ncbi:n-acyl-phosphatidylethanolamine-hydrolyzing phospholipase d family protein [Cyclospora cayetanensis]|uniref:N-acyl-phosphatidylethanolamine-hydrolyzing phospholipase d family protein n=1 Tax=Cyclospora cayetanensis TaxID=88456 RepID=A0A1D3D870_9EIME|nr:n-acyl-phosphatidylethanolamine-hydrolyzing phospholipase d family protein [Cyclospora cayetanensis]